MPDVALTVIDEILDSNTEFKISDIWNNKDLHELAISKFFTLLDKRLELCHKALLKRYDTLKGTKSDVAPILWQDGALARLKPGETIDSLLVGGYSTTSLGYVGLFETVKSLTGLSHTDPSVRDFAISIVKHLSEKCDEWNKELNLGFSLYGTPEESTTYKFAKTLQKHTTKIDGVNDKNYVINSYHVDVKEDISAFDKLSFESQFQDYTTGGAISYVEVPNMVNNIPAIIVVLQHIYENVMYAEMNCKLDCCMDCGYEGEILLIKNKNNKLIWKCPNCGCTDQSHMNIVRRVCGYLSNANVINQGRLSEIGDRKLHL